jgi:4-diphosphocytidyl-2-C-methyl-D-erythritol kinase
MALSAQQPVTLPAPAKINLFLSVTGRRADGYHTLETLFVPIAQADFITLAERSDDAIVREAGAAGVAPEDDLAVRAARLLQAHGATGRGVTLSVQKNVPLGAGLGGGSSDAATVLLGLNRLWGLGYSRRTLMGLALELGADVPFFVFGEPALGRGIGEILDAVSLPPTWFVVLGPRASVATGGVFAAPELTRNTASVKIFAFPEGFGRNDLQTVAAARFPEIADCLDTLSSEAEAARATVGARMSGSGSCVFAAFGVEDVAAQVLARSTRSGRFTGFVARALNRHPLWGFATP